MTAQHRPADAVLEDARTNPRPDGAHSPLAQDSWEYIEVDSLEDFSDDDWARLNRQRTPYLAEERARQALEMLASQKGAPSFGYQVNNYEHCLQSATLAMNAGEDEETIVATLFHDLGFVICNESHGAFAAEFLRPFVSPRMVWTLERHMHFQTLHLPTYPGIDTQLREKWRGHQWFEWTADWVRKYDIASTSAALETAPLSDFEPMVYRVFAEPRQEIGLPD